MDKIKNHINAIITDNEIKACIKLLPKYKQYLPQSEIILGVNLNCGHDLIGRYNYKRKNIKVHYTCGTYDLYDIDTKKLVIIGILIHELRHSYQHKMKNKIFNKCIGKNYHPKTSAIELDAYEFTSRFLLHNREKINYILNIKNNHWTLDKAGQLSI